LEGRNRILQRSLCLPSKRGWLLGVGETKPGKRIGPEVHREASAKVHDATADQFREAEEG
jgi:hypothetical protein